MDKIKNIILDPGHGGLKNGVYLTNGKSHQFPDGQWSYEGVFNRHIAEYLSMHLLEMGYKVVFTVRPKDPTDVSLSHRVLMANNMYSDSLYISIHNNAAPTPGTASGFEIFTSKGKTKSDDLANKIFSRVKEMYDLIGFPMRQDLSDGDHDKEENFYVLTKTKMPAVLLEVLFFDNYRDFCFLREDSFITQVSLKIALGIDDYIKS